MASNEKVVSHLQIIHTWAEFAIENPDIIFFSHDHHQRILEWTQDALNLLKEQQETITSLQRTICKLNDALTVHAQAEPPEEVEQDG